MKPILDVCCGSKMFYFDKKNPLVLFGDIRRETHTLCDGRKLEIEPDTLLDFTKLDFADDSFKLVVFDPPHLKHAGQNSWLGKKYGILSKNWRDDLKLGFKECMRVLEPFGILIFKWNETQIRVGEILEIANFKPLLGHKSGKNSKTHWLIFVKEAN